MSLRKLVATRLFWPGGTRLLDQALPLLIAVGMAKHGLVLWNGNRRSIEEFAGVFGIQWPEARS